MKVNGSLRERNDERRSKNKIVHIPTEQTKCIAQILKVKVRKVSQRSQNHIKTHCAGPKAVKGNKIIGFPKYQSPRDLLRSAKKTKRTPCQINRAFIEN